MYCYCEESMKDNEIVNKIISMYPELQKDREKIINNIKETKCIFQDVSGEIICDIFKHNGKLYYYDQLGCIYDQNTKFVGVRKDNNIFFFSEMKKYKTILNKLMRKK